MTRSLRTWPHLLLAGLAALPLACDYGPTTKKNSRGIYSGILPQPKGSQNPSGGGAIAPVSANETSEQKEMREAILSSVIRLIQSAATTPGGQHFAIAVQNLNEYFEQGTRPSDYYLSVDSRKFLQSQPFIGTTEAIRALESPTFGIMDARHIEDCMLYNEIATRVGGERLPGEVDDLPRVRRLFDWMVRHVQLVPALSLAPPDSPQAQARPYDVLLRGMATEAGGGWSERGWLFMSLCRQLGVDVGLVAYTPRRAPASLSIAPPPEGDEAENQVVHWVCAALIGDKAYLFDQRLGIAIPDAKGDGVATLEDAMTDPLILDRLDLPGQAPYPTNRASLLASGKVTILIDSSRGYFSPKMRLLQERLTGKNRTILFRDPIEEGRHFLQVLKGRLGDYQAWPLPYSTETLLFTEPNFTKATLYTLRPFDGQLPLLYARFAQLKGDHPEAIRQYVAMRLATGAMRRDKKTPISPAEQHEIDIYATYFLALAHLEQKNISQAEFFFKQLLERTPPFALNQREFCRLFRWGAATNLGHLARDNGDIPAATRYLSAPIPTLQVHGNFWIARELLWRAPMSPTGPPLPPCPARSRPVPAGTGRPAERLEWRRSGSRSRASRSPSELRFPRDQLGLPLVEQRPVDGAGAEVGHVGIAFEAGDRPVEQGVILAEDRAVRGEEILGVAIADAPEAGDEGGDVRPVMGVDQADAAVAEDVVAREEQVPHPERELTGRMARGAPDLEGLIADPDRIPFVDRLVDLALRHLDPDVLGVDPGEGQQLVPVAERGDARRVGHDLALQDLARPRQPLGVVDVGVRGEDHLAGREAEVHLADQLEDVGQLVEEADVDQRVFLAAVDQVDVHAEAASRLDVQLDHAGEDVVALDHAGARLPDRDGTRDRAGRSGPRDSTAGGAAGQ